MATIKIKGMSCNHCIMAVTKALNEIEGIKKRATKLSDKIKDMGYEVVRMEASDITLIRDDLRSVPAAIKHFRNFLQIWSNI